MVTTPGGTTSAAGFTFIPAPIIISFTPATAPGDFPVFISGSHFTGATAVNFGSTPALAFAVDSDTQITARAAGGSSGDLTVTTPGGTTTASGFNYVPNPPAGSFSPQSAAKGDSVVITGPFYGGASAVSFGGVAARNFSIDSLTQITAVVDNGTSGDIRITVPVGI